MDDEWLECHRAILFVDFVVFLAFDVFSSMSYSIKIPLKKP